MGITSPLHELHEEMDATFTDFAGFTMPVQFSSIKDEHLCVRKNVGIFDVSHMSNVWIKGKDAAKLLTKTTIEDASRFGIGKSQYTALTREDGTIIDDTIFMHVDEDRFMIIPNAGMAEQVADWLKKQAIHFDLDATVENVSKEYAIIAVQGPISQEILQKVTDVNLSNVGFFACTKAKVAGKECILSHTGYTGELGFELQVYPSKNAKTIFREILKVGEDANIKPVGLGARDTLRLEKCFLLAGNEFEGGRTPLEANLSWAMHWDHDFIGKDALVKQKEKGDFQRLTCLKCTGRGIPRHGMKVEKDEGEIGSVSSGNMSPCLKTGIALAYIDPGVVSLGDKVDIMIRGKPAVAEVVKPPFVKQDWAKTH
ncbi:MAG: glycine cleavage system aminomethyltransferase GcvT [Candidatus Thermoplasmatota archaeon]|nr:glycine cleavage system aminomethyltransferase GcvT [Candidatus Thermoplasmatota archaeon]